MITQHITQVRGDDFEKVITFTTNTSGFSEVWFTVRDAYATTQTSDIDAVARASVALGNITLSGLTATVSFPADTVLGWVSDRYVYDIQVKTTAGKLLTLVGGSLTMLGDVTRSS